MAHVVYSPRYNIGFFGLERQHPFDTRKYGRAWKQLRSRLGRRLLTIAIRPPRPIRQQELLAVHSRSYLRQLRDSTYLAAALEIPVLRKAPWRLIDWCVLRPMR